MQEFTTSHSYVPRFTLPRDLAAAIYSEKSRHMYELGYVKAKLVKELDSKLGMSASLSHVQVSRFFDLSDAKVESTDAFPLRPQCKKEQLEEIYDILPHDLSEGIKTIIKEENDCSLCEIRLDVGLPPRIALCVNVVQNTHKSTLTKAETVTYSVVVNDVMVTEEHILEILSNENTLISDDDRNRMYIKNTMHRVSALLEESPSLGNVCTTLTIRCGRHIPMAANVLLDVILNPENGSVLVIGAPGSGKTTIMRSMACLASGNEQTGYNASSNVFVVDTSRELGCDISTTDRVNNYGYTRIVKATKKTQNAVMEEVLLNHFPTIIAIDELEPAAMPTVRRIAASGVRLFATAHASSLSDALNNPITSCLLGDAHTVIRGDSSAMQATSTKKSILERTKDPIFSTVVQLTSKGFMVWQGKEHLSAGIDTILASEGAEPLCDFGAPQCRMWGSPQTNTATKEETLKEEEHFLLSVGWNM